MRVKKPVFVTLGLFMLALGTIGAFVPILPTFPFMLAAAYFFARSSERLHTWFIGTRLYKDNLEDYVVGKGMTVAAKVRIMVTLTIIMTVGFVMMDAVPIGRAVLFTIWVFHVILFVFKIKTIPGKPRN